MCSQPPFGVAPIPNGSRHLEWPQSQIHGEGGINGKAEPGQVGHRHRARDPALAKHDAPICGTWSAGRYATIHVLQAPFGLT
jgi:hypothetical protein